MLLRQHLRGGHQGALTAGRDRREQGGNGHNGFAASHIALHQPGHWLGLSQIDADFSQHALLGSGERKGQQGQKALHQIVVAWAQQQGGSRPLAQLPAPLQQAQLHQQKFIEHKPPATGLQRLLIAWLVDLLECQRAADQTLAEPHCLGEGIPPALNLWQHRRQRLA